AGPGLTGGNDLQTPVLPFILRGVQWLGIDSVPCPVPTRLDVWRRLATDLKPAKLSATAEEISLGAPPGPLPALQERGGRGRFVGQRPPAARGARQPSRPPRVGRLRDAAIALPAWSVSQFGPSFAARPACLGAFTLFRTQRSGIDRRRRCAAVE